MAPLLQIAASGPKPDAGWPHEPARRLAIGAVLMTPAVAAVALALTGAATAATGAAVLAHVLGSAIAVASMPRSYPHPRLGLCNLVTLARLAATSTLCATVVAGVSGWPVIVLAVALLCFDGVDGWLARREALASEFGARFDMEVDSALGLLLALNAWTAGAAPAAVIVLGLPRYAFVLAARVLPWLARSLPERIGRKRVCVLQIIALIVLQLPALPLALIISIVAGTGLALAWSFGRDVAWLWRARA